MFLHDGSERGKSEVATAAIMHHLCCDVMKRSKWPACPSKCFGDFDVRIEMN
jgi:hypothetical protein